MPSWCHIFLFVFQYKKRTCATFLQIGIAKLMKGFAFESVWLWVKSSVAKWLTKLRSSWLSQSRRRPKYIQRISHEISVGQNKSWKLLMLRYIYIPNCHKKTISSVSCIFSIENRAVYIFLAKLTLNGHGDAKTRNIKPS